MQCIYSLIMLNMNLQQLGCFQTQTPYIVEELQQQFLKAAYDITAI